MTDREQAPMYRCSFYHDDPPSIDEEEENEWIGRPHVLETWATLNELQEQFELLDELADK